MDIDRALKDGYSLAEVNQEAARRTKFNYAAAKQDGYSDEDINQELRKRLKSKLPQADTEGKLYDGIGASFRGSLASVGNVLDSAHTALKRPMVEGVPGESAEQYEQRAALAKDKLFAQMQERKKSRTDFASYDKEIGLVPGLLGLIPTIPAQMASLLARPFDTGQSAIDSGESMANAQLAQGITGASNFAQMAMPLSLGVGTGTKVATGAAGAMGLTVLEKEAQKAIAQTEKFTQLNDYTVKDILSSGLLGGTMGAAMGPSIPLRLPKFNKPHSSAVAERIAAARAQTEAEVDTPLPYDTPIMGEDGKPVKKRQLKQANKRDDATVSALEQAVAEQIASMPKKSAALTPSQLKTWKETQDRFAAYKAEQERLAQQEATQSAAQQAIDERQRALEQEVAQRAGLDFNAAERARQAEAPTGYADWIEQQRNDIGGDVGNNDPLKLPRQSRKVVQQDILQQRGLADEPFRYEGAIDPEFPIDNPSPLNDRDILARPNDPTLVDQVQRVLNDRRETPETAAARLAAPLEQQVLVNDVQDILNRGMSRGQRGAIDTKAIEEGLDNVRQFVPKIPVGEATELPIEYINPAEAPKTQLSVIPGGKFGQRGGFDLLGIIDAFKPGKQDTVIDRLLATKHYQQQTNVDGVIRDALAQGPTSVGSTLFGAGGTMEAAKTQNKAIQGAVRIRQREGNIAEDNTRSFVFPLEKALRKFSQKDMQDFAYVLRDENITGKLSMEQLASIFDEKSLIAYNKFREMQENALRVTNEARAMQGKKPITAEEAYLSSVWSGDFRMLFQDEKGHNVWALAAQTKYGLNKQLEALKKDFPEVASLKKTEFTITSNKKASFSGNSYSEILDLIGRDTPEGQALAQWYETKIAAEGRAFLGQERHFQSKSGTRGFIGDRPGKNPAKEAVELLQAQIAQAKSAFQWAGMQRAGVDIKKILSNEELVAQQPESIRWIREYWHDQLGVNDSTMSKGVDDMLRTMGLSPAAANQVVSFGKNLWTTQKLAFNVPFALASNGLQLTATVPHLVDLMVKHKANPISALILGPVIGTYMATGHILGAPRQMYAALHKALPVVTRDFWLSAMKYAEDNSIVARSIYDEAPIEKNFGAFNRVNRIAGKTITLPETEVRGVSFMTYVAALKTGFNKLSDAEIFRLAEERVSMSMGDYREGERAMVFNKAGLAGNAASTLTTFPMNYLNGWNWAGREAGRGNVLPVLAMFGTQAYVAGLMGIPGFADADKMIELVKDFLSEHYPTAWAKVRDFNLKRMALQLPHGESALYGKVSTQSGVGVTSRAAAPSFADMSTTPFAPVEELANAAGSIGSAAMRGFTDPTKNAQAAYTAAPTGLQGLLETSVLKDQTVSGPYGEGKTLYKNPRKLADREGGYARTPEEESIRKWGFRSQQETVTRELESLTRRDTQRADKVRKDLPNRVWNALRNSNKEEAKDYIQLYTQLAGKQMTKQQLENQLVQEFVASKDRAWLKKHLPLEQVLVLKRLRQQLEEMGYAD